MLLDLSFRLKGENLKGLVIVIFYIKGKYDFTFIEQSDLGRSLFVPI